MIETTPFFSIVIPVFNREDQVLRCVESVRRQNFPDFEIVLVDDGSTDGSLARMRGVRDDRVRVLAHARNRGVCPARNTGIRAARGRWIVFLDSDDELAYEGALRRMRARAVTEPESVAALWFRSRLDDGSLSPAAMPSATEWDYAGYLQFLEETRGRSRDMIRCVRRACFQHVLYPEDRMLEDKFHLDFARRFRARLYPDVLRLYHQDAGNQLVAHVGKLDPVRDAAFIADRAAGLRALLQAHGAALRISAPRTYRDTLARACSQSLLAGHRGSAVALAAKLAAEAPASLKPWAMLAASLAGPAVSRALRAAARGAAVRGVGAVSAPTVS